MASHLDAASFILLPLGPADQPSPCTGRGDAVGHTLTDSNSVFGKQTLNTSQKDFLSEPEPKQSEPGWTRSMVLFLVDGGEQEDLKKTE